MIEPRLNRADSDGPRLRLEATADKDCCEGLRENNEIGSADDLAIGLGRADHGSGKFGVVEGKFVADALGAAVT